MTDHLIVNGQMINFLPWDYENKDTSEIIFTEHLRSKVKLSLIGRVHVVNIFLLSRLWYRTEIFSFLTHILHEIEGFILDFVWAGKKHEVNKQLMSANLDQVGLKLVNIQNKITSQRIVWLLKLCSMEQACFTRVVAEEQKGHSEAGYRGLDFLKTNPGSFPIHSNNKFYEEVIKASNKVNIDYILMEEEQLMEEHIFSNPRILDKSGKLYKTMKELPRDDIFRVRDLSFKPGRKNYNKKVFNSMKEVKKHLPVLSSQSSQENNLPLNIILNKQRMSIDRIKRKDIYIEVQSLEKFNGDILGTMRNNVLKVSDILEA